MKIFLELKQRSKKAFKFSKKITSCSKDEHDVIVAGVIKHFELAYEVTWKFLKHYLEAKYEAELASPRQLLKPAIPIRCFHWN